MNPWKKLDQKLYIGSGSLKAPLSAGLGGWEIFRVSNSKLAKVELIQDSTCVQHFQRHAEWELTLVIFSRAPSSQDNVCTRLTTHRVQEVQDWQPKCSDPHFMWFSRTVQRGTTLNQPFAAFVWAFEAFRLLVFAVFLTFAVFLDFLTFSFFGCA